MNYTGCANQNTASGVISIFKTSLIVLAALCCALPGQAAEERMPNIKPINPPILAKCKSDLAKRLKVKTQDVRLAEIEPNVWPDASLGMPRIGKAYAQASTPGFMIKLTAGHTQYLYTAADKKFSYGGPVDIWSYSLLYTKPIKNDANLNMDLYQCSLLGTNPTLIASQITDYYPQTNGVVLATRRTSRSGFELLFAKADGLNKPFTLYSAFAFGAAALNDSQTKWAAFIRTGLGSGWKVIINDINADRSKVQLLDLPDDIRPKNIAWTADKIQILADKGTGLAAYEITPGAAKPEWAAIRPDDFPGIPDLVLNKSQTLSIEQVDKDGKKGVEVSRLWFTGDHDLVARVEGLTMRGFAFLGNRYVLIWGEKASSPTACVVDIATNEVLPCFGGISGDIKPALFPPHNSPLDPGPVVYHK